MLACQILPGHSESTAGQVQGSRTKHVHLNADDLNPFKTPKRVHPAWHHAAFLCGVRFADNAPTFWLVWLFEPCGGRANKAPPPIPSSNMSNLQEKCVDACRLRGPHWRLDKPSTCSRCRYLRDSQICSVPGLLANGISETASLCQF